MMLAKEKKMKINILLGAILFLLCCGCACSNPPLDVKVGDRDPYYVSLKMQKIQSGNHTKGPPVVSDRDPLEK
jgi:hypothetical protein